MTDLFLYLEEEHRSGELEESLATELALEHRPDSAGLRLRDGYHCHRAVRLLRAADLLLSSADEYDNPVEAMTCAALVYTALVDAMAPPMLTRLSVHEAAYAVFTGVLEEGFGRSLHLDGQQQRRLYRQAIATARQLDPNEDPLALRSEAIESLLLLMKEYEKFLEN